MNKTNHTEAGRIRHSITNKLNRRLFLRLLGLFLCINIAICIITTIVLWLYFESTIERVESMLGVNAPLGSEEWMELSGINIREITDSERALHSRFHAEQDSFISTVRSFAYVHHIRQDGVAYDVSLNIGQFILFFSFCFGFLIIIELVMLLSRTIDDRRMVRRTLEPISELARAAQSLNDINKQLDHEKMMALAGKLDGIDAGRLDTRIHVDDLQEELKNVAVAINGMLDRINESYVAQARFVSDASHELRTPIAVIQGYANLLDRWGKEDEKALSESVAAIKDEAGNMKDLVEQLLFLARGDSNRIRLTEERVELSTLADEVACEARMLDDGREFIVATDNTAILADKALIKQALRILVDNAVKYTDTGGEITISAGIDGSLAKLSVADTGIGIRSDILPRVFDRFVRADESRARATGGAGLGLSIAQWIASRHNGHMEILSREGIGTRITLLLPAAPPPGSPQEQMIIQL